ncbi:bifunctional riboflavin kinase/FAD synthetase [Mariluticola halotolerans]|uniref:bifunctional riboflavin kinase/FAD synthetase n=1 Tax=Mariluticola halotolerans TaxID=2909283 RepID=UPI0026E37B33|nr:bifunctional riboflavin kinase/FAD synthetase [Mariluticola halotolerans]UJQ95878.1 bifunctional riboflavin kinase/FAD synthetase [Mariluticola halotolerans]
MTEFKILHGLGDVPSGLRNGVVAIGNFDGCHRGHQRVFASATSLAKSKGKPAVVLTFEPHPRDVFAPEPFMFRLTDGIQKARLAKAFGFDGIVVMPFNRDLAGVEAEDFVGRFIIDALNAEAVVVGEDFHFGKRRGGTPEFLAQAGTRHGFEVHQLNLLEEGSEPVSSSRIRDALNTGELETANRLLGYHWIVEGTVIVGDQRGRELGYPTANFALPDNSRLTQGIYAVRLRLGDRLLDGVASFGKPMFDNVQPPFEVHIFDFDEDIYGEKVEVALISHIRGQMTFDGLEGLIKQMDKDSAKARDVLQNVQPLSDLDRELGFII